MAEHHHTHLADGQRHHLTDDAHRPDGLGGDEHFGSHGSPNDEHSHDHRHHQDPGRSIPPGLRALIRPHSHDAGDSVDDALEGSAEGIRAVAMSLLGLG